MSIPTAPFALYVYRHLAGWFATRTYGGFATDDEAGDWFLSKTITAMCAPLEVAWDAFVKGTWNDPALMPDQLVETFAVCVGVDTRGADIATLREWIPTGGPTRQRGGDEAIIQRVKQVLTGTREVRIYPRTHPGFPGEDREFDLLIRTRTSETPGGVDSVIRAARDRAAPVWLLVHAQVMTGSAWDETSGDWNSATGTWEAN